MDHRPKYSRVKSIKIVLKTYEKIQRPQIWQRLLNRTKTAQTVREKDFHWALFKLRPFALQKHCKENELKSQIGIKYLQYIFLNL